MTTNSSTPQHFAHPSRHGMCLESPLRSSHHCARVTVAPISVLLCVLQLLASCSACIRISLILRGQIQRITTLQLRTRVLHQSISLGFTPASARSRSRIGFIPKLLRFGFGFTSFSSCFTVFSCSRFGLATCSLWVRCEP